MAETASYERQAEEFLAAIEEEYYLNGAGLKHTLDLEPIYAQHADLFALPRVNELLSQADTRAARYLAQFAATQYLERSVCELTATLANLETQATVEWHGEQVPYRMARALVTHEPDQGYRRQMIRRIHAITESHNPVRVERFTELGRQTRLLGFDGCIPFCESVLELNVSNLSAQTAKLLSETAAVWHDRLALHLQAIGIAAEGAHIVDLRYALAGPQFEHLFPRERLMPALERTLLGIGIDLGSCANLHLDTEDRELKSNRPFCSPVRVPADVRLVTMARGGREDYNQLLHEAGHAIHYSFTDAAAPFPFRCLGDISVTEGYAFLFNLLLRNPEWLREVIGMTPDRAYMDFACFYHLYQVRRLSARLAYELELHATDLPAPGLADAYCRALGGALLVEMCPENHLGDVDDALYSARYLRAWMLEVQLRDRLVEEYGPRWFASPKAGDFLKNLWSLGQTFTAEEMAQRLGYSGIEVEPLTRDLMSA